MNKEPKANIREVVRLGWRPFLAKVALLGATAWGANEYMYPDTTMHLQHETATEFAGDELTIMTANVHDWESDDSIYKLADDQSSTYDVATQLNNAIERYQPDVICAQEVAKGSQLQALHERGYNVIHATTARYPFIKETGNAVLSKSLLHLIKVEKLPSNNSYAPRNAIIFDLELEDDRTLTMSATHFGTNQHERLLQGERMMGEFGHMLQGSCGDFNADDDEIIQGPVAPLMGLGNMRLNLPTHPARGPLKEIDHIMLACGKPIAGTKATFSFGSDHMGVVESYDISQC